MSLGATKGKARDRSRVDAVYELYGIELSFFTQKMRAALQWYFHGEFKLVNKTPENSEMLETRAATHQIPVIVTPENWALADSTPMLQLLDSRLAVPRFYPADGFSRAVVGLVEEYFDEWMARLTVHTRWHYPESAAFAAAQMMRAQGIPDDAIKDAISSPASPIHWGKRVCRAVGMTSERQIASGVAELLRIHQALDSHLKTHRYVLGEAPCAIDCVLVGGLRAHFLKDPWPRKLLTQAGLKHVQRYCDEWDMPIPDSAQATPIDPENLPPFVDFVLREMGGGFRNFVLGNARAQAEGSKSFKAEVYGEEVSYLARPYVEKSRRMLQSFTGRVLNPSELGQYNALLKKYQISDLYTPNARVTESRL